MKKIFLTLGAILVFGITSAQTDTTKTPAQKQKAKTERSRKATQDTRTQSQLNSDAQKNINSVERPVNAIPTPPASAPGSVNTNSSAMPQVTPPITTPPPGAPPTTPQPASPVPSNQPRQ